MSFAPPPPLSRDTPCGDCGRRSFDASKACRSYATILPALRAIGGVMLTSEIAGVATAVFSVTHFHRLTLLGTLGNVAAMPFISFIVMPAGFLAVLLMAVRARLLSVVHHGQGLEGTMAVARFVSSLAATSSRDRWPRGFCRSQALPSCSPFFRTAGSFVWRGQPLCGDACADNPPWHGKAPDMVIAETADLVASSPQTG